MSSLRVLRRVWLSLLPVPLFCSTLLAQNADPKLTSLAPATGPADSVEKREAWTGSRLRGTPTPPDPFRVVPAFPGVQFVHPVSLQEIPGAQRLLVAEIGGRVWTFSTTAKTSDASLALDLKSAAGGPVSLFGAALHPKFESNHYVYFCLVHPEGNSHTRVSRFTMNMKPTPTVDPKSEVVILTWPSGGHNGGCLKFGVDGMLYISTGDGSGPNPPDGLTTGQDVTDLLGAILRIDVDHPTGDQPYSVPHGNPFVNLAGARAEIFGYGLRNPWKFGIDSKTGEVFVADNGWETWEMIHLVGSGTNCGWPVMEGRARLRSEVPVGPTPITPPIWDHHHSEANSVIGGPVYRGRQLPSLEGEFIYGDYITGTIWSAGRKSDGSFQGRTLADTDLRIIDFLETSNGEVLVLDYDLTGRIYQLVPSDVEDLSAEFPRRLSQTGLFQSLTPLTPAAGVVPYNVVSPRWMDGAVARRFVAIPGKDSISLAAHSLEHALYPEGTVFAKHLMIPGINGGAATALETQLLHLQDGVWNPYCYLWKADGTDAELVASTGQNSAVEWPDPNPTNQVSHTSRTWRSGATNECKLCHNAGPGFVLGFVGNQLDRPVSGTSGDESQLAMLLSQNVINANPNDDNNDIHRLVDPHDATQDLNDRARSYLHGNCAMCHHKGGNAIISFFVTRGLSFEDMSTQKGTNIGTFGMHDAKIIVPGDPYRSVLFYRMSKLGYARMPYIGSQAVDSHGVALIEKWIRSLPAGNQALSPPLAAGSEQAEALETLTSDTSDSLTRQLAIQKLVTTTEGTLALAARLHSDRTSLRDHEFVREIAQRSPADLRGLLDEVIPEMQRKRTLGRTFDPSDVLTKTGDVARGRLIFFSDTARCRNCHHADDATQSVGPTLKDISRKYAHSADLLQQIIAPSHKIEDKFAAWTVVLTDGRVLTGLIDRQSDEQVVLRTADRQTHALPRETVEQMQKSAASLMPDGLLADLTGEEAADLVAYIHSLSRPDSDSVTR